MSYDKNIYNYTVKFKEEIDYLNCRIDYLGHCKFDETLNLHFLQFIQSEMYDKNRCEIESIVISPIVFTSTHNGANAYWTYNYVDNLLKTIRRKRRT